MCQGVALPRRALPQCRKLWFRFLCVWQSVVRLYTGQLVCALEYLHSKGYVHRDVKPENMLVTAEGVVKLCDLGAVVWLPDGGEGVVEKCYVGVSRAESVCSILWGSCHAMLGLFYARYLALFELIKVELGWVLLGLDLGLGDFKFKRPFSTFDKFQRHKSAG